MNRYIPKDDLWICIEDYNFTTSRGGRTIQMMPPEPLHSPRRNRIAGRPAFIGGTAIPAPTVWPLENGNLRVSFMLPVPSPTFAAKWFDHEVSPKGFISLMEDFEADPEGTLEDLFSSETTFRPELRKAARMEARASVSVPSASVLSVADLDV